jgi:hypothetical protein
MELMWSVCHEKFTEGEIWGKEAQKYGRPQSLRKSFKYILTNRHYVQKLLATHIQFIIITPNSKSSQLYFRGPKAQ